METLTLRVKLCNIIYIYLLLFIDVIFNNLTIVILIIYIHYHSRHSHSLPFLSLKTVKVVLCEILQFKITLFCFQRFQNVMYPFDVKAECSAIIIPVFSVT